MIIDDIYTSKYLKYPLTSEEYVYIDQIWKFLEIFENTYIFNSDFRHAVISKIRKEYDIEKFYKYESILNKMFWNLRWLLFPLWYNTELTEKEYEEFVKNNYDNHQQLPDYLLLCEAEKFKDENDLDKKLKKNPFFESTYYRSFINKLVIIDKKNKTIFIKPIEGSSHIFGKNYFNLLTMTILFDKELYEEIMTKPYTIKYKHVKLSEFYYEYDYGFPNLNFCTYQFGSEEDRQRRIKKMYFYYGKKADKYWFKLIK